MVTVTLKDLTFVLLPPKSLAASYDVAAAVGKNPRRGMFAALGLCWGGPKPLRSKFANSFDALQYGGEVFDELIRPMRWTLARLLSWNRRTRLQRARNRTCMVPGAWVVLLTTGGRACVVTFMVSATRRSNG